MKILKSIFKKSSVFLSILLLLIIFTIISACSYASTVSSEISNSVFRLHVIANSDSDEDQNLKYKVRDALLKDMNELCINVNTKEEAINIANQHLDDFRNIAENTINENGFNYSVSVSINQCDFPTKYYGDIALPAGTYDALRIKIGNASGHNWWCVMFPPLCFVDVTSGIVPADSKKELYNSLDSEEYNLINTSSTSDIAFKFKIVELIENIKMIIAKEQIGA